MNITNLLRKNIGTIVAVLGFILLCIVTFGDLGELVTEQYWANVKENITAISFVSIGLTFIQISIKQGLAEQALQRGLNTDNARQKYEEHRQIIKENTSKMIYLPYFLQIYNRRHTQLQKREYLVNNNYTSEKLLYFSNNKKLIKNYEKIIVHITASSIKWSTVDILYDKNGKILTLNEHRRQRIRSSILTSFGGMIGVTFLAGGLFFRPSQEPIWQKFVKLFTYCVAIAIGSIFTVIKEYEKGAFGVPNELEEINQIWHEFNSWEVPEWVVQEVEDLDNENIHNDKEVKHEQESERAVDNGADLQEKSNESETVLGPWPIIPVSVSGSDSYILLSNDGE